MPIQAASLLLVVITLVSGLSPAFALVSIIQNGVRRDYKGKKSIEPSGKIHDDGVRRAYHVQTLPVAEVNENQETYLDCFQDKTVYFAGNSLSRGLYFTMAAMLEGVGKTGVPWTDRGYQKRVCKKERSWPPTASCSTVVGGTATLLVNSWTQRLNSLKSDLEEFFVSYKPDFTIVEVGFDHIASEWNHTESGTPLWEVSLQEQFGPVADVVERYYAANPEARLLWRALPPFDEKGCWNEHLKNAAVLSWNQKLLANIKKRQWLEKTWFQWHEGAAQLVEQALQGQDGLRMDDWIHPDTETHLRIDKGIMQSLCE